MSLDFCLYKFQKKLFYNLQMSPYLKEIMLYYSFAVPLFPRIYIVVSDDIGDIAVDRKGFEGERFEGVILSDGERPPAVGELQPNSALGKLYLFQIGTSKEYAGGNLLYRCREHHRCQVGSSTEHIRSNYFCTIGYDTHSVFYFV